MPGILLEHMDALGGRVEGSGEEGIRVRQMKQLEVEEEDIRVAIGRLKDGKQPGPDKIRQEFFKWLAGDEMFIGAVRMGIKRVIEQGRVPETWKMSRTSMLPKVRKPEVGEHRPVALTNTGYKLFMAIVKDKICSHLEENNAINPLQVGFSKGRRLEENLFILEYCVESSYRMKKGLVVVSVDLAKAFDSVDRGAMMRVMEKNRIDGSTIDILRNIYSGDRTEIFRDGRRMGQTDVTRGIRQGCTGSPQLFVMVANEIICKLQDSGRGYRDVNMYLPCLFYVMMGCCWREVWMRP